VYFNNEAALLREGEYFNPDMRNAGMLFDGD
jgi:hypothetical protein